MKGRAVITFVELRLSKKASNNLSYPALENYLTEHEITPSPENIYDAVCALRHSKLPDPSAIPNAGSFFKNPVITAPEYALLKSRYPMMPSYEVSSEGGGRELFKIPAAWLIDTLGFKGKSAGGIGVHDRQALVVVNPGHRTGEKILEFARKIACSVEKEFNIDLEIEPQVWGLP